MNVVRGPVVGADRGGTIGRSPDVKWLNWSTNGSWFSFSLLQRKPKPTSDEIEHILDGNLCRCTGYRPIFDAFKSFSNNDADVDVDDDVDIEDIVDGEDKKCCKKDGKSCSKNGKAGLYNLEKM